jgi:hypothetical protein
MEALENFLDVNEDAMDFKWEIIEDQHRIKIN